MRGFLSDGGKNGCLRSGKRMGCCLSRGHTREIQTYCRWESLLEAPGCNTAAFCTRKEGRIAHGRSLERYQTSPAGKRWQKHGITAVLHSRPGGQTRYHMWNTRELDASVLTTGQEQHRAVRRAGNRLLRKQNLRAWSFIPRSRVYQMREYWKACEGQAWLEPPLGEKRGRNSCARSHGK